jgi:sirohydrochlorin ferrochelatase
MLRSLEETMPVAKKKGVRFYQGFLDNPPRPDEAAIRAVNEGASRLVVMPVFLTDSSHTQAGQEMLEALELEKHGVEICYASPLWDAPALRQMFLARAAQNLDGVDKSRVGILLVGHGQPEDWDKIYPTQTEQETLFREAVRDMLIQDGYRAENIVLAWMEFKEPKIQAAVSELLRNGVERVLVFSASISADSIHSDIQVPEAVHSVPNPGGVRMINLGAWGDDPLVIDAIRQKILDCDPSLEALADQ